MNIEEAIVKSKEQMDHSISHLVEELTKIRTGKASPSMLSNIMVDYYGTPTPINQVANLGIADAKTITIQPWDKKQLATIEQAIFAANIGLTPMNDGEFIRITIPPLTEERRKDLVKQAKHLGEEGKVSIRNARHEVIKFIKAEVKDGYPEDEGKKREDEVEKIVKNHYSKIDDLIKVKEKDILTI